MKKAIEILKEHYIKHNYYDDETLSIATQELLDYIENSIPKQKVENELNLHIDYLENAAITSAPTLDAHFRDKEKYVIQVLQKLLKGESK